MVSDEATLSLPTVTGYLGTWAYRGGAHGFTPTDDAPVALFDPTATSSFDNQRGAYRTCEGGRFFGYEDAASSIKALEDSAAQQGVDPTTLRSYAEVVAYETKLVQSYPDSPSALEA